MAASAGVFLMWNWNLSKKKKCRYVDVLDDTSMGRQNFSPSHFELGAMKLETSYSYNVLKPNTQHKQTC